MDIIVNNHYNTDPEVMKLLKELSKQQLLIIKNQNTIMGKNEELESKLDELQSTVDDVQAKLTEANAAKDALLVSQQQQIDTLETAKEALQTELRNSVSPDQTNAAIAKIDATIADVKSTIAAAAPVEGGEETPPTE